MHAYLNEFFFTASGEEKEAEGDAKEREAVRCRLRGDCHADGYVKGGIVVGSAEFTDRDRYVCIYVYMYIRMYVHTHAMVTARDRRRICRVHRPR
jgi:hypothetical protein